MLLLSTTYALDSARGGLNPWPSPAQTLLLRVALSEPALARECWRQWSAQHSLEQDVDEGSFALMGLVYRRAEQLQLPMPPPVLSRLRGIYRYLWSKNQALMLTLREAASLLLQNGLATMLHTGFPLVDLHYRDWGLRMSSDLDLLLPEAEIERAHALLLANGWRTGRRPDEAERCISHAATFHKAAQKQIDLHWRPYFLDSPRASEQALWARSQQRTIQGLPVVVPEPVDLLLLACFDGRKPMPTAVTRWVVDAAVLIRDLGHPDWSQLQRRAADSGLEQPLGEALRYLHEQFGLAPGSHWRAPPVPRVDRMLWQADRRLRALDRSRETTLTRRHLGLLSRLPLLAYRTSLLYVAVQRRKGEPITGLGWLRQLLGIYRNRTRSRDPKVGQ